MARKYRVVVEVAAEGLDQARRKIEQAGFGFEKAGRAASGFEGALKRLAPAVAGLALAAVARDAVRTAAEFQRSFRTIDTLVGVSRETLNGWRGELSAIAAETGRLPQELSKGLFTITSAGERSADALVILREAARGAAIGLGETVDSARVAVAAQTAYGKSVLDAKTAVGQLAAIVREGNLEAAELGPRLGDVLPFAAQLQVSFSELGANIATFTRLGVKAGPTITSLRQLLGSIASPAQETHEALAEAGTSAENLRQMIVNQGLAETLIHLVQLFDGNTEALGRVIPSVEALSVALGTAGSQADEYRKIVKSISEETEGLGSTFEALGDSPALLLDQLAAVAEDVKIAIGEELAAGLADGVGGAIELAEALRSLQPIARSLGEILGTVVKVLGHVAGEVDIVRFALIAFIGVKINAALAAMAANANIAKVSFYGLGTSVQVSTKAAVAAAAQWNIVLAGVAYVATETGRQKDQIAADVDDILRQTNAAAVALGNIKKATDAAIASGSESVIASSLQDFSSQFKAQAKVVGKLRQELGAATAEVEKWEETLQKAKSGEIMVGSIANLEYELRQAKKAQKEATQEYQDAVVKARTLDDATGRLTQTLKSAETQTDRVAGAFDGAGEHLAAMGQNAEAASDRLAELRRQIQALSSIESELDGLRAALEAARLDEFWGNAGDILSESAIVAEAIAQGLDPLKDLDQTMRNAISKIVLARAEAENLSEEAAAAMNMLGEGIDEALADTPRDVARLTIEMNKFGDAAMKATDFEIIPERRQRTALESIRDLGDEWLALADIMSSVLVGIDEQLAAIVGAAADAFAAFQDLQAAAGGTRGERAIAGAGFGFSAAGLGQQLGLFQGDRGTGRLGGDLGGDYSSEGGALGGAIGALIPGAGPLGGVVGGILGSILGGLFSRGADQINIQIASDLEEGLTKQIQKWNDALSGAGNDLADGIIEGLEGLEAALGIELGYLADGIGIMIRGETIRITVGAIERTFEDLGEAIDFAIVTALQYMDIQGGSENVRNALTSGAVDTLEELQHVLTLATELDSVGLGPVARAINDALIAARALTHEVEKYGLSAADAAALVASSMNEIRQTIVDELMSIIPGGSALGDVAAFNELAQGVTDFNAEVDAMNQAVQTAADAVTEAGESFGGGGIVEGADQLDDAGVLAVRTMGAVAGAMAAAGEEADRTAAAVLSIDPDQVAQAAEALQHRLVGDIIGSLTELASMVGRDLEAELERQGVLGRFREAEFQLRILEARMLIQAARSMVGITQTQLEMLADLEGFLNDLADTEFDFTAPPVTVSTPSGGAGDGGRAARRQTREDFAAEVLLLEERLSGVAQSAIQVRDSIVGIEEWAQAARDAGTSAALVARGIGARLAVAVEDWIGPLQEEIRQAGETDTETARRIVEERRQALIQEARILADGNAEVFARLMDAIEETTAIRLQEIADQIAADEEARAAAEQARRDALRRAVSEVVGDDLAAETRRSLEDVADAMQTLRDEVEKVGAEFADAAAMLERIDAGESAEVAGILRGHLRSLDQAMQELGQALPDEVTQALARAELALAQARALEALQAEETRQALLSLGFTAAEVSELIGEAVASLADLDLDAILAPTQGPTFTIDGGIHTADPGAGDSTVDALARLREQLADWARSIELDAMSPLERALAQLSDKTADLRAALIEAGASAADMAELERIFSIERTRLIDEAWGAARDNAQAFLDSFRDDSPTGLGRAIVEAEAQFRELAAGFGEGSTPEDLAALQSLAADLLGFAEAGSDGRQGALFQRLFRLVETELSGAIGDSQTLGDAGVVSLAGRAEDLARVAIEESSRAQIDALRTQSDILRSIDRKLGDHAQERRRDRARERSREALQRPGQLPAAVRRRLVG